MKILEATLDDIPALVDLIETCYRGEDSRKGWTTEVDIIGGTRVTPVSLKEELDRPGARMLKCVDNDEIVGCAYTELQGSDMYTGLLCVKPDLQAAGLGKKMMAFAEDLARKNKCSSLVINTVSRRTELVQWYVRQGFKPTGKVIPFIARDGFGDPKVPVELIELKKNIKLILN